MAFKFTNLSLRRGQSSDKDLDPDTAIIDDTGSFGDQVSESLERTLLAAKGAADQDQGDGDDHDAEPVAAVRRASRRTRRTPLLGRLSLHRQTRILLAVIGIGLLGALGSAAWEARVGRIITLQNEVVGDAMMHSQRLAKAAGIAVQGNALAFDQLKGSLAYLTAASTALTRDGLVENVEVPAATGLLAEPTARFAQVLASAVPDVNDVLREQAALIRFNQNGHQIRAAADELILSTHRAVEAARRAGAPMAEVALLTQMDQQLRTISGEMSRLLQSSDMRAEDASMLAGLIDGFATSRSAALQGNLQQGIAAVRTAEARQPLQQSAAQAEAFIRLVQEAQKALPALEHARAAGRNLFINSDRLTDSIAGVRAAIANARAERDFSYWLLGGFGLLSLAGLLLLGKAYYDDSADKADEAVSQRAEAERLEQDAKRLNDLNQAAILRLMNELQEVADGDLTVQATVSEDITGAIADSVNYTVEELRSLVGRINRTAAAVAEASAQAQITSTSLQAASDQQSREIRETGEAVLKMAAQIKQVSESAAESADVARQSLSAAGRGRDAVQNAIVGMNGIRDQIQETAKRIKRLGESSQEIGEIIELISDITEQTNVLALNAAIQAASAGEAGRGFTVVAEEVQRLAERSAEATRQISALVKAIQTDTHDAVAAMERSTQGVVQGTKLSDQAGTALSGIGEVSQELADLIMRISRTTESQAESAGSVAQSIQRILLVTEQTSEGTQQTAGSILQLSELARELKNSVSRFRVE